MDFLQKRRIGFLTKKGEVVYAQNERVMAPVLGTCLGQTRQMRSKTHILHLVPVLGQVSVQGLRTRSFLRHARTVNGKDTH